MQEPRESPLHIGYWPLTAERWDDLETLFGKRGACGGCWCMWWRLKRSDFDRQKGDGNRAALHALVTAGDVVGLLAYAGDVPIGWCAVAPRDRLPALDRSRVLKRVDEQPVWSITCFYVARPYRRRGLSVELLRAAIAYASEAGATVLEGYPVVPRSASMPDVFAWTGMLSAFEQAGFVEVARHSESRPIVRYEVRSEDRNP